MRSKELIFFEDHINNYIEDEVYDYISENMKDDFEMTFEIDGGYTLTLYVDMREYEDYEYEPWDEDFGYFRGVNRINKYMSIERVYAICERDGEGDDDFYEADITNLFRSVFTDTQERKRMFSWICSTAAVLSFILWIAILIVVIIECFKYLNKKKDDKKRTTMLR